LFFVEVLGERQIIVAVVVFGVVRTLGDVAGAAAGRARGLKSKEIVKSLS
jgi:hypothetical protein